MRNIFAAEATGLQQGCIFNGAIMDGYGDSRAFGLIITPRCDIAQCKVPTVHYLPIVRFEDWRRYFLTPLLEKHKIPKHIIKKEYKLSDDDLEKCFQNQNVRNAVVDKNKRY